MRVFHHRSSLGLFGHPTNFWSPMCVDDVKTFPTMRRAMRFFFAPDAQTRLCFRENLRRRRFSSLFCRP